MHQKAAMKIKAEGVKRRQWRNENEAAKWQQWQSESWHGSSMAAWQSHGETINQRNSGKSGNYSMASTSSGSMAMASCGIISSENSISGEISVQNMAQHGMASAIAKIIMYGSM